MLILVLITFATSSSIYAHASHGGGTAGSGGGCSGDCTSPTLGLDEQGTSFVDEGLTINSESFDVEQYSQTIPTQIFKTNEKNIISLKIYENTSPEYLSHVEIHFNPHDKVVGGVSIEEPIVSIVWDDTGGEVIQGVYGNEEMITDISIEQEIENSLAIVTFEFEFTQPLDTSTLMVKIWDEERNPSKNYFYDAIKVVGNSAVTNDEESSSVPTWVKNNAGWWAAGEIDDQSFIQGIQYLVKQEILKVPAVDHRDETDIELQVIPEWVKNNAGWWAAGEIDDQSFIQGIQYLVKSRIIQV